ncbi:hypothetical protein [Rhodococcus maanshanensis]|uniref:DUF3093 domain-containing protein n=1 Tax=Rhodococcus maanshanensis TaxID=183556 RepID=A0A1H7JEV0_9NOCA|nr:hypothetical protein [Rhodococcus maanshanensis]SEK72427.1 hypothetical protein SAMN05444583_103144 [Rhodococcus maanshanensis]
MSEDRPHGDAGSADVAERVLFEEPGGRWSLVALGPALCLVVLVVEAIIGSGVHWLGLALFAALLAGLVALQVVAARRHASVLLTPAVLRNGAEALEVTDIAEVLPEADPFAEDLEPWESAPSLGELSGVPRRRTGIGLRLRDGSVVRAWARDGDGLRSELERLVADEADEAEDGER